MSAWRLDKQVQVLRAPMLLAGLQRKMGTFAPFGPVLHAGVKSMSDGEKLGGGQKLAERIVRLRLRALGTALQITPRDRLLILAEDTEYDILAVKPGEFGGWIEVTARARADLVPA